MRYIPIDVPDENDSYFKFVLDNVQYNLRFTWNETGEFWKFGVYTSLGDPIVEGMKVVPEFPLNAFHTTQGLPFGAFVAKTAEDHIGRRDFADGKASFRYVSVADNIGGT